MYVMKKLEFHPINSNSFTSYSECPNAHIYFSLHSINIYYILDKIIIKSDCFKILVWNLERTRAVQSASEKETICASVTSLSGAAPAVMKRTPAHLCLYFNAFDWRHPHLTFNSAPVAKYTVTFYECRSRRISRSGVMWRLPTTAHSSICSGMFWTFNSLWSHLNYSSATTKCVDTATTTGSF